MKYVYVGDRKLHPIQGQKNPIYEFSLGGVRIYEGKRDDLIDGGGHSGHSGEPPKSLGLRTVMIV